MTVADLPKNRCYGCGACDVVCPSGAIHMAMDDQGFYYPVLNMDCCIDCACCVNACPAFIVPVTHKLSEVYAFRSFVPGVRSESASGGAFSALSDAILEDGGIVYGAAFEHDFTVKHVSAEDTAHRNAMRGSKYVQSSIRECFRSIEENLLRGRTIFFTGTPCQCASVTSFLHARGISDEGLVLCDIVCHGVTSPLLWERFLLFLENRYGSRVANVRFRSKRRGWYIYDFQTRFEDGRVVNGPYSYLPMMFSNCGLRPVCFECPFHSKNRPSDISIGDFFGIEADAPAWLDEQGVSLVAVNASEKGRVLLASLKGGDMELEQRPVTSLKQMALTRNVKSPVEARTLFWRDFASMDNGAFMEKYARQPLSQRAKDLLKAILLRTHTFRFVTRHFMRYAG